MEGSVQTEQALLEEVRALRDKVAELEQREAAQREENHRIDEFLGLLSHELRTPLTTINGNIQIAKRRLHYLLPDETPATGAHEKLDMLHELLSRAERQVRIQNRMVGDLLDVSRIHHTQIELHAQIVDLLELVRDTVYEIQQATPERELHLEVPDVPEILVGVDAERISQVMSNFVSNAFKYSPTNQPVFVCLEIQKDDAMISIEDRGVGVPAQEQQTIWQRFYQVAGVKTFNGSSIGLGLGLYINKNIIEQHGGGVGVKSTPNQGSTFWFRLPII